MVRITSATVSTEDGRTAATIDLIEIGGGSQTVTVDGSPEERVHPRSTAYHVRLLSPDRMVPDQLRQVDTYDAAVALGERYAEKLAEHADRVLNLVDDLQV